MSNKDRTEFKCYRTKIHFGKAASAIRPIISQLRSKPEEILFTKIKTRTLILKQRIMIIILENTMACQRN